MERYYIAYKDEDGNDFNGFPWIDPQCGTISMDKIKLMVSDMSNSGYQNVIPFVVDGEIPEIVDWNYVEQHKIAL
jgi:hypothetical protein